MDGNELFAGLMGEGTDAGVVQIARQCALALALQLVELLLLSLALAAVFDGYLCACGPGKRQGAIRKAVAYEIGRRHCEAEERARAGGRVPRAPCPRVLRGRARRRVETGHT